MPLNTYKHPNRGFVGRLVAALVNARWVATVRRSVFSRLPFLTLESDVVDVVYLTWLIPVEQAKPIAPQAVKLWQKGGLTPFTILTYSHRHLGPSLLGPLRSAFPSPLQSNWRLYLSEAPPQAPESAGKTVLFIQNILSSLLYVVGARTFSDALPAHLPAQFVHARVGDSYRTEILSGVGSSPSLTATVRLSPSQALPSAFQSLYATWSQAIEDLALQDAAVVEVQGHTRLAFAEIDLPIELSRVLPAELVPESFSCPFLEALAPVDRPLCFVVPQVRFKVRSEQLL